MAIKGDRPPPPPTHPPILTSHKRYRRVEQGPLHHLKLGGVWTADDSNENALKELVAVKGKVVLQERESECESVCM
jgi:hypothetical protein